MGTLRKVCIVVTARASYARVKAVIDALALRDDVILDLMQVYEEAYEDSQKAIAIITGSSLISRARYFACSKPDVVLTVGDRYETIATAIAASYQNIPLAHLQGGEVSGNIDEKVRHAVTKLADLHFTSTPKATENVIRMGEDPKTVFMTGCPSIDIVRPYKGLYNRNYKDPFIIVVQHPVTTELDDNEYHMASTVLAVEHAAIRTLWVNSNHDAGWTATMQPLRNLQILPPQSPEAFAKLLSECSCLVGNSSVALRECGFLGVPAVNIGNRQLGRERGINVVDVLHDAGAIHAAILSQFHHGRYPTNTLYGDGESGPRVATLLATVPLKITKQLVY